MTTSYASAITTINVPGVAGSAASGINDVGQVAGVYFGGPSYICFVATPSTPPAAAVSAITSSPATGILGAGQAARGPKYPTAIQPS